MAAIRALGIFVTIALFFLIGAPAQWLMARYAPAWSRTIPVFFCRSLLWLLKVRLVIEGDPTFDRPTLVVSNHISWIDILVLGRITPFCFLAKSEVARWPILSAFAEVQGTVFVDRKRRRTIPQANKNLAERLLDGRPVLLFPEGTTIKAPEPGPFRTSHFAAARDFLRCSSESDRVDVQPVAMTYSALDAAWIGDEGLLPHLWKTLRAPSLLCVVRFGIPISYVRHDDRKQIAAAARASVVKMLAREPLEATAPCTTGNIGHVNATSLG